MPQMQSKGFALGSRLQVPHNPHFLRIILLFFFFSFYLGTGTRSNNVLMDPPRERILLDPRTSSIMSSFLEATEKPSRILWWVQSIHLTIFMVGIDPIMHSRTHNSHIFWFILSNPLVALEPCIHSPACNFGGYKKSMNGVDLLERWSGLTKIPIKAVALSQCVGWCIMVGGDSREDGPQGASKRWWKGESVFALLTGHVSEPASFNLWRLIGHRES